MSCPVHAAKHRSRWQSLAALALLGLSPLSVRPTAAQPVPVVDGSSQPPAARPPRTQPASTRQMVELLARNRETAGPGALTFQSDRMVTRLQHALTLATNLEQQVTIRFQLANQLLQDGKSEEALAEFQRMENQLKASRGSLGARGTSEVRMRKATALLRIGEQENCQLNHSTVSCLFPLLPAAYHQLPRGSRGAIVLLTEQLKEFPEDLRARWLLNLAHMTLGEWPDKVPVPWLIPPQTFASEYDLPRFPDVAGALGLDVDDLAGGCVVDDFDNDGFLDVMASVWSLSGQLRYFHNDGNGHFTERTDEAGLTGLVGGLNIQQTDYNNDGWLDLWVLRGAWTGAAGRVPNSLLRNNGDGTFTDVTVEAGIFSRHPTQSSVWFDYDGDGWLDVFIGNESGDPNDPDPSELFHNNGNGTFTECAEQSGLRVRRFIKGVTWADYDRDGRPDLYLSCLEGSNILFHNDGPAGEGSPPGTWKFSDVSHKAGVADQVISFPTWFFDYDNDGWEDLFVSGYRVQNVGEVAADYLGLPHQGARMKLYHNNQNGTFSDVTVATHLNRVSLTMGSNFGDLDNDGWLDFYLGTGNPDLTMLIPNRMFRNAGGRFFQEVTTAGGFGHLQKGHGVAFADLDNDGDQDVYVVMGGAFPGDNYRNSLFLNPGSTNHWVKLKLEGTRSNRAAIGARIKVTVTTPTGVRDIYKTVNSGGSFGSSPLLQELGLADATAISSVEIVWPASGLRQIVPGLELDRAYHVKEGDAAGVAMKLRKLEFDLKAKRTHTHGQQAGL